MHATPNVTHRVANDSVNTQEDLSQSVVYGGGFVQDMRASDLDTGRVGAVEAILGKVLNREPSGGPEAPTERSLLALARCAYCLSTSTGEVPP